MKSRIKTLASPLLALLLVSCTAQRPPQTAYHPPAKPHPRLGSIAPMPEDSLPSYSGQRTVDDVLAGFGPYAMEQLRPHFHKAGVAYPPREITLIALKDERKLEVWARDNGNYRWIRDYPILAASGGSGPKLRQGDRQVPEGVYRIVGLNPNSNYHLSMRLDYPNAFDLYHAREEGRADPGSDIFIHGKNVSAGCLAMGDAAIEELFVLTAQTGKQNVKVVIAPHDPRLAPLDADGKMPFWTQDLYARISEEILAYGKPAKLSAHRLPLRADSGVR